MPMWLQYLLWASAAIIAIGTVWTKVIRPGLKIASTLECMVPLLSELTVQLKDTPSSFSILKQIIAEFRTDSGSSLRDVVDRIDRAGKDNKVAAEVLKVNVEAVALLAVQDRAHAAQIQVMLDKLAVQVAEVAKATAIPANVNTHNNRE